ncbi:Ribosomal RNA small subunit methyltransferase G [Roseovarius albus]|uniref:Ribosomal RNA small subunit methyltransferase G n=1 Tax=Roseovarius albus TaxID=1247867 RepID=A0A1X6Z549_9RHOB|nr:16S rRNA (guanine(527)-N(7))-methyltransferase RsmG [Roseovarius albus]SLN40680.1 Ribosomal RNA small subunit methyltransferase G [Roseovarius albus]
MNRVQVDVSRETKQRLDVYLELLKKWNSKINLVSPKTIDDAWNRHFVDSFQIHQIADCTGKKWVDVGSGAGFPGLVAAIAGMDSDNPNQITLIESDMRKCMFLRTVIREINAPVQVINDRIEKVPALKADVISARALADLNSLIGYAAHHLDKGGIALFPKGKNWQAELEEAESNWTFGYTTYDSQTDSGSVIMSITGIQHV